jgi:hypothetical protein
MEAITIKGHGMPLDAEQLRIAGEIARAMQKLTCAGQDDVTILARMAVTCRTSNG